MNKIELLAPAGNLDKLNTAFYFGADAVYCGGKAFSLRSYADNFNQEDFIQGVKIAHKMGKKVYVTINIFARNHDFEHLADYLKMLESIGVDGVILSDPGIIDFTKKHEPKLEIHISTQANTLNKYSA
ncbi:MAG: U32 family peptidase, partial [Clostridia bacterium]|nr:U32 family peptidase [Clostridia bacterium]